MRWGGEHVSLSRLLRGGGANAPSHRGGGLKPDEILLQSRRLHRRSTGIPIMPLKSDCCVSLDWYSAKPLVSFFLGGEVWTRLFPLTIIVVSPARANAHRTLLYLFPERPEGGHSAPRPRLGATPRRPLLRQAQVSLEMVEVPRRTG